MYKRTFRLERNTLCSLAVLLMLLSALAACVAPTPTTAPAIGLKIPARLVDTRWAVIQFGGSPPAASDASAPLTLQFGGRDTAGGSGGCTTFRGSAAGDDDHLTFGPLAAGAASCGEAVDRQQQAYMQALQTVSGYALAGDELVLLDAAGQEVVRLSRLE